MLSRPRKRALRLALLPLLLAAPGCAKQVPPPTPSSVSAALVKELQAPKPQPGDDILTNDAAAARYSIAVETWGDRLSAAGGRLCRSLVRQGVALPFDCPAARTPDPEDQ